MTLVIIGELSLTTFSYSCNYY